MANINGESQTSFRWLLSCATIGIAVTVSPCFAQGDRDASQEPQRLQAVQRLLGPCDSLDPKVCFDIYQRRMEQVPERTPDLGWLSREYSQAMFGKSLPGVKLPFGEMQPGETWMGPLLGPHSSECFGFIKDWVDKKIRRHMARAQGRTGVPSG